MRGDQGPTGGEPGPVDGSADEPPTSGGSTAVPPPPPPDPQPPPPDQDSPWKAALTRYLPEFMALCLPRAHADIDWARGYRFRDRELQQVTPASAVGRRVVDVLVEVTRRGGTTLLVLIHIEVQGRSEAGFAERMYGYHYRIFDRFRQPVVSVAVLTDSRARWRPRRYAFTLWDCSLEFQFPSVKLLDFQPREAELAASRNPFAHVILAQLAANATRRSPGRRADAKLTLIRRLYQIGFDRAEIVELFRFIDWLVQLPEDLDLQVWHQLQALEEVRRMPYVTSVERLGIARGRAEGLTEGLRAGLLRGLRPLLGLKFPAEGEALFAEVESVEDVTVLQRVVDAVPAAASPDDVRRLLREPVQGAP